MAIVATVTAVVIILVARPFSNAGLFVATGAAPVLLLVYLGIQSRPAASGKAEWYPTGYMISWLGGVALVYLVAVALYYSGPQGGLEATTGAMIRERVGLVVGTLPGREPDALARDITRLFPATMLTTWQMIVLANYGLAQGLLVRFQKNIRTEPAFASLDLPRWPLAVLVVFAAASMISGQVGYAGRNGLVIIAVPFFFLGLSVIHALSSRWRGRPLILMMVYLVLLIFGWPAVVVAGLGFAEPWTRLRRRFGATGSGEEEE